MMENISEWLRNLFHFPVSWVSLIKLESDSLTFLKKTALTCLLSEISRDCSCLIMMINQ